MKRSATLHAALGLNPDLPIRAQWSRLLFHAPPIQSGARDWPEWFAFSFPHIDFHRFRLLDVPRFLIQLLWLSLVIPPQNRHPSLPLRTIRILNQFYRRSWRWLLATQKRLEPLFQPITRELESASSHNILGYPLLRYSAYLLSGVLAFIVITTPFDLGAQLLYVVLLWGLATWLRRIPGDVITLIMIVLSLTISCRYFWWRMTTTLDWSSGMDITAGLLLLFAELYAFLILILGYFQVAWPLHRKPQKLPVDLSLWPTVDVYIPTYNEPLPVVKPTIMAAMGMDWPRDRLNIYLLDDGRREEFRSVAESLGIGYIIRNDNRHAKAGNLNNALSLTKGEYIAIFDCDHRPTRSFLQTSMGLFLDNPKLALVQTPHYFFSPDPFEHNLGTFQRVPNEGELFYGVVQDGNDLWNAAFFCGSCAIMRRGPLQSIGGIATETVTEDAHTSLRLHRLGFDSAYIRFPQAAGLATENLAGHVGQRIRWARGMAQIFRIDNPFLGPGLSWPQRLCYGNAMLHFFSGLPRLIYLTIPLAYLVFNAYSIYASALGILLYALPHIIHTNLTNSRIQGHHRYSFWAEVYETVLAWYIARPAFVALVAPHKGRFNVTSKGGLIERNYFDWDISRPYLWLIGLNLLGISFGIYRLIWGNPEEIATVWLNLAWVFYNLLVLGVALGVAGEIRQVRKSHRVKIDLEASISLPDGRLFCCRTLDYSEGGIALRITESLQLAPGDHIKVNLPLGLQEFSFPARVIIHHPTILKLQWAAMPLAQEKTLMQCIFSRADTWSHWGRSEKNDQLVVNLREIFALGIQGYQRLLHSSVPYSRLQPRRRWLDRLNDWLPHNPSWWTEGLTP
jgi:cellulose synthase (UDP-forming)